MRNRGVQGEGGMRRKAGRCAQSGSVILHQASTIPYHTIPYHTMLLPYHAIPCHIIPYTIIP